MEGYKTHRHELNPKEKEFHDKFIKDHIKNKDRNTDLLVFAPTDGYQTYAIDTLSVREKEIMITTVQWLGSPVGQGFLHSCGFKLIKDE